MEFLDYLKLGKLTQDNAIFLIYFFGIVGGYCIGRAHAAWITLNNFIKAHG